MQSKLVPDGKLPISEFFYKNIYTFSAMTTNVPIDYSDQYSFIMIYISQHIAAKTNDTNI